MPFKKKNYMKENELNLQLSVKQRPESKPNACNGHRVKL